MRYKEEIKDQQVNVLKRMIDPCNFMHTQFTIRILEIVWENSCAKKLSLRNRNLLQRTKESKYLNDAPRNAQDAINY